ncbi:YolD-like family protein [Indiicoccus explosivorum]|uniref:YolD-like family protein n=1 Tax=Indiicoccus explosivorum TaxID=1917864 RepID=UPI000B438B6C|nr:YolD-like family protein [Indiicoccus explosivorum]
MKQNRHMRLQGDIKDRGMVKWQGMMLPEHMKMLKDWYAEDDRDPEPQLTADDFTLIQEEIETALARQCEVRIKTWRDHKFSYHKGVIKRLDAEKRTLVCEDPFSEYRIRADDIVDIRQVD